MIKNFYHIGEIDAYVFDMESIGRGGQDEFLYGVKRKIF
jgi:hypothetical protein